MQLFGKEVRDSNAFPREIVSGPWVTILQPFIALFWALIIPKFPLEGIFIYLVLILRKFSSGLLFGLLVLYIGLLGVCK